MKFTNRFWSTLTIRWSPLCIFLFWFIVVVVIAKLYDWEKVTAFEAIQIAITLTLVIATAYYAIEARKIRLEAVRPSFSLKLDWGEGKTTGIYDFLRLQNSGGVARDLKLDIRTDKQQGKQSFVPEIVLLSSPALDKGNVVNLPMERFEEVQRYEGTVKVKVSYKDSYGINGDLELDLDFGKEGRQLVHQWSILVDTLKKM